MTAFVRLSSASCGAGDLGPPENSRKGADHEVEAEGGWGRGKPQVDARLYLELRGSGSLEGARPLGVVFGRRPRN